MTFPPEFLSIIIHRKALRALAVNPYRHYVSEREHLFDAFSSCEPVSISPENAMRSQNQARGT
jgi:hypothetical protein